VAALLLLELVLRVLTWSGSFASFPLLPLDPAASVRAAQDVDFSRSYLVFDRDLGWTVGPDRQSANGLYRSDTLGARRHGATGAAPGEAVWALCFGDSFTHGDDVSGEDSWVYHLSRKLGRPIVNFGVPGYGIDQALLRYGRLGGRFEAPRVLIGLMADNIGRHVNRYRPYISPEEQVFFVKPRFLWDGRELSLLPSPFRTLGDYFSPALPARLVDAGREDRWYRPERYQSRLSDRSRTARVVRTILTMRQCRAPAWRALYDDPSAVELTHQLVRRFAADVLRDGRQAIIVFFPDQSACRDALEGRPSLAGPLLDSLRGAGLTVLDLTDPLARFLSRSGPLRRHFIPHYSAELNEQVAIALDERLGR